MGDFIRDVFRACSKIKKGRVSTYKEIARAIGKPRAFRAVGNALNTNRSASIPCHRVVCSDGSLGGFAHGSKKKADLLIQEGIEMRLGRINKFDVFFQRL